MNKLIFLIKVSLIVGYILCGCSPMRSGFYTVKEVRGSNTVVLREVQGDWHIPSDTLKVGDKVYLTRTKKTEKINVW